MDAPNPFAVASSVADRAQAAAAGAPPGLAIALGANLPSPAGEPLATLVAARPQLELLLLGWGGPLQLHWSPLFRTAPVGGPADQPAYLNGVLLVEGASDPNCAAARSLLGLLHGLEQRFGRQRRERWGPRSLDLDLLWWGNLRCGGDGLELPHPRLLERSFVLAPLAAIQATLVPPGAGATAANLLAPLLAAAHEPPPQRLAGRPGWPE
jgi:2-amino-4-hydroxy-6-hydroxymethyldihydropteridine diphosphokinase